MTPGKRRKKQHRAAHPLGWLLLAALLGAGAVAAGYFTGAARPQQRSQRESRAETPTVIALYSAPESPAAETPSPAPEATPETAVQADYEYEEILSDEDGILLARIRGKRYKGVLAVIDDPTRLFVGSIPYYGEESYGMTLDRLMERCGAVLGLNGGGFDDSLGQGRGGSPLGVVMCDGIIWLGYERGVYDVCAFTREGKLIVGQRTGQELLDAGVHSAVSFGPALIIDGQIQEFAASAWEPRSAVGQRADGSILLMALEGRQVSAQGADFPTLAEAMARYGAVNATNLDGGASSSLLYKGELMNICNSVGGLRTIPTAILVRAADGAAEETAESAAAPAAQADAPAAGEATA